jgi:hypothetical protein
VIRRTRRREKRLNAQCEARKTGLGHASYINGAMSVRRLPDRVVDAENNQVARVYLAISLLYDLSHTSDMKIAFLLSPRIELGDLIYWFGIRTSLPFSVARKYIHSLISNRYLQYCLPKYFYMSVAFGTNALQGFCHMK